MKHPYFRCNPILVGDMVTYVGTGQDCPIITEVVEAVGVGPLDDSVRIVTESGDYLYEQGIIGHVQQPKEPTALTKAVRKLIEEGHDPEPFVLPDLKDRDL